MILILHPVKYFINGKIFEIYKNVKELKTTNCNIFYKMVVSNKG